MDVSVVITPKQFLKYPLHQLKLQWVWKKQIIGPVIFKDSNSCPLQLILTQLFPVYTEGNKIGHSIFSAWTERQYIKWIFIVAWYLSLPTL